MNYNLKDYFMKILYRYTNKVIFYQLSINYMSKLIIDAKYDFIINK